MMDYLSSNQHVSVLWGGVAFVLVLLSYLVVSGTRLLSRQALDSKALREASNSIDESSVPREKIDTKSNEALLEISELWIYPIKSLRGARIPAALITPEGFYLDRRYMLLKVNPPTETEPAKLQNMHVPNFPTMCLFQVTLTSSGANFLVSFTPPSSYFFKGTDILDLPLEPAEDELRVLERVGVEMYGSRCSAYNMGSKYNNWFSERFGFPVVLAFWGGNARPVLGNRPGRPANEAPRPKNAVTKALASVPVLGSLVGGNEDRIAFNDVAPFLVINSASVEEVTSRIEQEMDPSKFRPNIILKGSKTAFEEDFWAELTFTSGIKIILTANCVRCASLNVDYNTGAPGKGRDGEALKVLQKDRRVDMGNKYSPVFGRYGFPSRRDANRRKILRIGDGVVVTKRNKERTTFAWPGM